MTEPPPRTWQRWLPLVIAALVLLAFLPAIRAGFVAWDDEDNFLLNPFYRGLGLTQLRWMWTTFHMGHYVPVTWMSLGADYLLWGMNPAGYHAVNVLLHAANAVLLFFLARRLFLLAGSFAEPRVSMAAAAAALLFGLHPLRVESVAWVTERRDMLSLFFYLATILAWLRSLDERRWFWIALALFACALLSKGTAVTLPAVLLLLDVYPLRRIAGPGGWSGGPTRRALVETLPFFALSAIASFVSIVALAPGKQLALGDKIAVSVYGVAFYLWKTLVPAGLSPLYRMPADIAWSQPRFLISAVCVIAIGSVAFAARRRWPAVAAALLAFLVVVLPMLGIVQNGPQIAADRYTYHASPALALLAASALLVAPARLITPVVAAFGAIVLALGALTWRQTLFWRDSESLWRRVLAIDEQSSLAHTALANLLVKQDRVDEAIEHYRKVIVLDPESPEGNTNLGVAYARQGRLPEAIEQYRLAIARKPSNHEAHNNLGTVLARAGDLPGALVEYRAALAAKPDFGIAHTNWGNALVRLGRVDEALPHYEEAVRIRPTDLDAHLNWGVALALQKKYGEAIRHFTIVLEADPNNADARLYFDRANALANPGNRP